MKAGIIFLALIFSFYATPFQVAQATYNAESIVLDVPYTSQAPTGNWRDQRFREGCEEASILMAGYWSKGEKINLKRAEQQIKELTAFEKKKFGFHQDTSAKDTAFLYQYYFGQTPKLEYDINTADIRDALMEGAVVIVPINGNKFAFYGRQNVPRHMVVVRGYDYVSNEFVINDPLAKNGNGLRIRGNLLEFALRDYPSGIGRPVKAQQTAMIVIRSMQARAVVAE